jgi:hypothetical protein
MAGLKPLEVAAAFERFWTAYPVRPGNPRHPAQQAFTKLVKAGEPVEALIASAGVFAQHHRRLATDPLFIPHARTWLAQRRFEDFPASTPSAPSPEGPVDHPLSWLRAELGDADFGAWIGPLRVEDRAGVLTIIARTGVARDRVRQAWGRLITDRLGAVGWIVERNEQP